MTRILIYFIFFLLACDPKMDAPQAKKQAQNLIEHGNTRIDNYFWMNQRDHQDVITHLNAENRYAEHKLKPTKNLQDAIYNEIVGRMKQEDQGLPYLDNGYWYGDRYLSGKEYPIYWRKKDQTNDEIIFLDINKKAEGFNYFQLGSYSVSPDNKILAYSVDTVSRRNYSIYFENLETGVRYKDIIAETSGSIVWANDNQTVFYVKKDPQTLRAYQVMKHRLGDDSRQDQLVYEEKNSQYYSYLKKSISGAYIFIVNSMTESDEYYYLPADKPSTPIQLFQSREAGLEYEVDHADNLFYVRSNYQAKNFRILTAKAGKTSREFWTELVSYNSRILIESFVLFKDFLVLQERQNGLRQIRIINHSDKNDHLIDFGEAAYTASISVNRVYDSDVLRYNYTSLTTPNSTYDYHMTRKEKTLMKREEVVGGYQPEDYQTERIFAKSGDVKVPISLVYKKSTKKNKQPLLLYGYGSYGSSMNASFVSARLSLLDRGFIFAIAHIRGGSEMGRDWYETGKMKQKLNTFNDFIASAEHLITNGYTSQEQLAIQGGSAGGLLIGAVINMRPDLFKVAHAAVPFVDVVSTMLDSTIPLTTFEYKEWGNPYSVDEYNYMLRYSPYDNVRSQNYPHLLVTTGYHDSQVQYFEPAKWVAKLRELKTDKNDLIFTCDMESGHGGTSGRFKRQRETAKVYTFFIDKILSAN